MIQVEHSRITWADSMKAFSIMAVVLYHTQIMPEIKTAAYLVCLPAFFFVSGLFTNTNLSPKDFFIQKTLRLLIPYILWGILTWGWWYFITSRYGTSTSTNLTWWQPLSGLIYGRGDMLIQNAPLWFLCCMISLEWVYYMVCRAPIRWLRWCIIVILGITGCLLSHCGKNCIWEITSALIVLPIYAIGAEYNKFFKEKVSSLNPYILVVILVCALFGLWLSYIYNGNIRLIDGIIGNPFLYYISALSTIGLWLSISLLVERIFSFPFRLLRYIGQNTLFILCAHMPAFSVVKGFALLLCIPLTFFESTIGSLILWICTFIILLPVAYLINQFFPILVGKKSK